MFIFNYSLKRKISTKKFKFIKGRIISKKKIINYNFFLSLKNNLLYIISYISILNFFSNYSLKINLKYYFDYFSNSILNFKNNFFNVFEQIYDEFMLFIMICLFINYI